MHALLEAPSASQCVIVQEINVNFCIVYYLLKEYFGLIICQICQKNKNNIQLSANYLIILLWFD